MAFTAGTDSLPPEEAWLLYIANLLWTVYLRHLLRHGQP
jgi:4-hydroxybenzoate polyprenyltransferase